MSCKLNRIAGFDDIFTVKSFLFPDINFYQFIHDEHTTMPLDLAPGDAYDTIKWRNRFYREDPPWLQKTLVSFSPVGDIAVMAYQDRIVHLSYKWNSRENTSNYCIAHKASFAEEEEEKGILISCVCCLPLASHKKSMHGGVDWSCIMVGFNTGYVKIYTVSGMLLLSQQFSEGVVMKIKCATYMLPRYEGQEERHEEIIILFNQSMAVIDGFSFLQTMKACKNYAARASAGGSSMTELPTLAYKKHFLVDQEVATDAVSCGLVTIPVFDQLLRDSLATVSMTTRNALTSSNVCLVAGTLPYINFFHTLQNSNTPVLMDVAGVMADTLKNALMSAASDWLGIGGKITETEAEPQVPLHARYGLHDKIREATCVSLSPDLKLAAVTDSFGRVVLLDVAKGIAIRIWKGYRDAQVGWIESKENTCPDDNHHNQSSFNHNTSGDRLGRRVMFFVIHAPRRGILEVWSAPSGPRVAAFNTPKTSLLIQSGYGVLGLNNASMNPDRKSTLEAGNLFGGVVLMGEDGWVKEICVPFHAVFSSRNDRQTRDKFLMTKLKIELYTHPVPDIQNILRSIKTISIKSECLEIVLSNSFFSSKQIRKICASVLENIDGDSDDRALKERSSYVIRLLDIYDALMMLNDQKDDDDDGNYNDGDGYKGGQAKLKSLLKGEFHLDPLESEQVATSLDSRFINTIFQSTNQKRVTFRSHTSVCNFIAFFERDISEEEFVNDEEEEEEENEDNHNDNSNNLFENNKQQRKQQHKQQHKQQQQPPNNNPFHAIVSSSATQETLKVMGTCIFKSLLRSNKNFDKILNIFTINQTPLSPPPSSSSSPSSSPPSSSSSPPSHQNNLFISAENLMELLMQYVLSIEITNHRHLSICHHSFLKLFLLSANKNAQLSCFSGTDSLWEGLVSACIKSHNVLSAFILILIARAINFEKIIKSGKVSRQEAKRLQNKEKKKEKEEKEGEKEEGEERRRRGGGRRGKISKNNDDFSDDNDDDVVNAIGNEGDIEDDDVNKDNEKYDDDDEWVTISKEKFHWITLTKLFHDLLLVENLFKAVEPYKLIGQQRLHSAKIDICMKMVVEGGTGVIAEMIGRFISNFNLPLSIIIPPDNTTNINNTSTTNTTTTATSSAATTIVPTHLPLSSISYPHPPSSLNLHSPISPSEEIDKFVISPSSSSLSLLVRSSSNFSLDSTIIHKLQTSIRMIQEHFPSTGHSCNLACNSCWELIYAWDKNTNLVEKLDQSIIFLRGVKDNRLRHGLCQMIWQMFIQKKISLATDLVVKVGKAPKERLIMKELDLTETSFDKFLTFTASLLDIFLESTEEENRKSTEVITTIVVTTAVTTAATRTVRATETTTNICLREQLSMLKSNFNNNNKETKTGAITATTTATTGHTTTTSSHNEEFIWNDFTSTKRSSHSATKSLSHVISTQPTALVDNLYHHKELVLCLRVIMAFKMKAVKVMSLFDNEGAKAFFKSLDQTGGSIKMVVNEEVVESRKQFLERLIVLSVSLLGDASINDDEDLHHVMKETGYSEWAFIALELGILFRLDQGFVASKLSFQLYASGFDSLAEKVMDMMKLNFLMNKLRITNQHIILTYRLAVSLTPLAGCRLKLLVFCREVGLRSSRIAMCSTSLSNWLQSIDSNMATNKTTTIPQLTRMLRVLSKLFSFQRSELNLKSVLDLSAEKRVDEMLKMVTEGL